MKSTKTTPTSALRSAGLILALLLHGAASADAGSPSSLPAAASPQATAQAIDRLLAAPQHCRADADCRTLAIGERACGGPESYRAYSARVVKPAQAEQAGQRHREARSAANTKSGMVSTCVMLVDPGAQCSAATKTCELRPTGALGGAGRVVQ